MRVAGVQFWAREYLVVRERKKVLVGRVVSNKMQKTVVVAVQSLRRDRLYQRMVRHTKKFLVHDEHASSSVGIWCESVSRVRLVSASTSS